MAKLDEKDARWIVEERADGRNVGQWHWVETDVLQWSRERLGALLCGLELCTVEGVVVRTSSERADLVVTGDAFINKRKGKTIPGYELNVQVKWEAAGSTCNGLLSFLLAEENADETDKLPVRVTSTSDDAVAAAYKTAILKEGVSLVRSKVAVWVREMAAGAETATNANAAPPAGGPEKTKEKPSAAPKAKAAVSHPDDPVGGLHTIRLTEKFYARPADIFAALCDQNRVRAYAGGDATISAEPGAPFSLFGGAIIGSNTADMVRDKCIAQTWRARDWPDGIFSNLKIELAEPEHGTVVCTLVQSGIPEKNKFGDAAVLDTLKIGWKQNTFTRIRSVFGYGA